MAYVAVVKALYDYAAQDPDTELNLKEDQIAYVIDKEDEDWWKAKLKDEGDAEGAIGLIPVTYVEELPPLNTTRALYAYEATSPEELSMDEDDVCEVFSEEADWLLVRVQGKAQTLGFVPRTYCEPLDASREVEVPDAAEAEADLAAQRQREAAEQRQRDDQERQRQLRLKDKVETWSVSELDGRKKKKGTLGVGNGAVFFASDTDKSPVKQYPITDLESVTRSGSKEIQLSFPSLDAPLRFHCGSNAAAILAKLETSKEAAGEALQTVAEDGTDESDDGAAEPKAVRWAPEPATAAPPVTSPATARGGANGAGTAATVMYDFDAQGDDELSVQENDAVTVLDKENDEWWLVRNARGQEGVVPAQYVQVNDGSAPSGGHDEYDAEEQRRHDEEEAAAAAALEAERAREREQMAAQRRAIERASRERAEQEDRDREMALDLERREVEKQIRRQQKRELEDVERREAENMQRREAARQMAPPKIAKRPSAQDVAAAAARLPDRGRAPPDKPEHSRPKPNPGRVRTWSDKSGQFKVDAEYLGMNGRKIRLHKVNGVIIEVPVDKMSHEDAQMIKRYEARKQRQMEEEDDLPLGHTPRRGQSSRSAESSARRHSPPQSPAPAPAAAPQKQRKPAYDWFAFFLEAGCSMDDCTRYAANFERDRIDETLLPDLEASTLRSLGLKEGDVLRVRKEINVRFAKKTPEQEAQIRADEDYARQLQEYERGGGKGPVPQPPPSLFTGPDGKLANNTRRGRPERKGTVSSVDPSAVADVTDQLSKMNTGSSTPPPVTLSPPPEESKKREQPANLITGFDDDAWTIKPSSAKPASPAPVLPNVTGAASNLGGTATSPSTTTNGADSLLAQIHALRPAATGAGRQQQLQQTQTGSSGFSGQGQGPSAYGLGAQGTGQSMGAMMQTQSPQATGQQQYNPNAPRGPMAPVPTNEGLLNPMQPNQTGMFVPTRGSPVGAQQTGYGGGMGMGMGMQQQQTGFGMQPQPTGYAQGFQQGYGMQPNFTGMQSPVATGSGPGQQFGQSMHQNASSTFNSVANVPLQGQVTGMGGQQQQGGDKFAPGNIFAAMKKADFAKPEEQRPQDSGKYDALRPLATGYNGAPGMAPQQTGFGMGMAPQQTGYGMGMGMGQQPQQTGYGMGPQQTGMGMYGQQGQGQQQQGMGMGGGMMPQMTGYNPYAGQNQYGQFR